jgi:hypothetical protein
MTGYGYGESGEILAAAGKHWDNLFNLGLFASAFFLLGRP